MAHLLRTKKASTDWGAPTAQFQTAELLGLLRQARRRTDHATEVVEVEILLGTADRRPSVRCGGDAVPDELADPWFEPSQGVIVPDPDGSQPLAVDDPTYEIVVETPPASPPETAPKPRAASEPIYPVYRGATSTAWSWVVAGCVVVAAIAGVIVI